MLVIYSWYFPHTVIVCARQSKMWLFLHVTSSDSFWFWCILLFPGGSFIMLYIILNYKKPHSSLVVLWRLQYITFLNRTAVRENNCRTAALFLLAWKKKTKNKKGHAGSPCSSARAVTCRFFVQLWHSYRLWYQIPPLQRCSAADQRFRNRSSYNASLSASLHLPPLISPLCQFMPFQRINFITSVGKFCWSNAIKRIHDELYSNLNSPFTPTRTSITCSPVYAHALTSPGAHAPAHATEIWLQ